jgi:hypothetical protein
MKMRARNLLPRPALSRVLIRVVCVMSTDRPNKIAIDKSRHAAQRKALAQWRERQREIYVTRQTFGDRFTARVLVDGEYYDVDEAELASLRAGVSPDDLDLSPVVGD